MREHLIDEADRATDQEMTMTQKAIDAIRGRVVELEAKGRCYNCDEPVAMSGQKFCDRFCAEDHYRRSRT